MPRLIDIDSIHIGDVFCMEIDNSFKCYFQFIDIDKTQSCTPVINIFKTHYPIDFIPCIESIVRDEILCSVHTIVYDKYLTFPWYKIGNTGFISSNRDKQTLFIDDEHPNEEILSTVGSVEYGYWWIWEINGMPMKQFPVPYDLIDRIENGAILYPEQIADRMKFGYDRYTSAVYNVIKRKPSQGIQSFIKSQCVSILTYYHFDGENLVRQITIPKIDNGVKIETFENREYMKFWDRNWKEYEFITPEQFESAWNKYKEKPKNPITGISKYVSNIFRR